MPSTESFLPLLALARAHWKTVTLYALLGGIAGGVAASLRPPVYQSGAAFEVETGLILPMGNSPLAGQTAVQFVAELLTTHPVLRRVAKATFHWDGRLVPLASIFGADGTSDAVKEYHAVTQLRSAINVDVNFRAGVVRFTIAAPTPELAMALAETTLAALDEANAALRQRRATPDQAFAADRVAHARQDLRAAEQALVAYQQRQHAAGAQLEEAHLRREVDVAQQVYGQLRVREEEFALDEARSAPRITVIEPPLLPLERSSPRRRSAVVLGLLVGVAVAVVQLGLSASGPPPVGR